MIAKGCDLVVRALTSPSSLTQQPLACWDLLIRQARHADLLARIALRFSDAGLIDDVPQAPRAHLIASLVLARAQQESVLREVEHIRKALAAVGQEAVLMKGAAYLAAGLPAASGRMFGDIDVLVSKSALGQVEAALMQGGWATTHHRPYDQRYYREWMHELPPFQHIRRGTVLDVHHAIVPETARLKPDSRSILRASRSIPDRPGIRVLAPEDMVLHSMTHLFLNEEWQHGLRDLSDLDLLLRHFGESPDFWQRLPTRAHELDLTRPLFYGLRYTRRILGTPVPAEVLAVVRTDAPGALMRGFMDVLWKRALRTPHASADDWLGPLARKALYIRAHWLRMPPLLLARHLVAKSLMPAEA